MEIELAPLLHQQFEPAWTAAAIPATNYFPRKNSTTLELAAGSPPRSKTAASAGMFIKYRRRWRTDARILLRFRPRNSEAGGAVEGGSIFARGRGVEECIEYLGRQMGRGGGGGGGEGYLDTLFLLRGWKHCTNLEE